ncbi:aegerolysin family protein [Dapis sp. BLCC M126]|uniref:aegerolysin family protein n=1 Tax=Dapis sp. BLCC M126 TaxID=3400189 RepID=UPI003CED4FC0
MAEAQNFHVAAKNHTQFNFEPGNQNMKWGDVYDKKNIKARTTTTDVFYARGNRDVASGTEGSLTYTAKENSGTTITFNWDIPWGAGQVELNVTTTGNIKLEKSSFTGNEVLRKVVTIVIKDDAPLL